MQIRPYQETDRPFLRTLYLASRKAAFGWRDTSNYQLEDFDGATLGEAIWVAEDGGTLLGFVSVYREDNFIHNLYVDPISRRAAPAVRCCRRRKPPSPPPAR